MVLSDRIAVPQAGALHQYDTPRQICADPANRFVAGFIGSPKMNFLEGRLEATEGGAPLKASTDPATDLDVGRRLVIQLDPSKFYLFDRETDDRIRN